MSSVRLQQQLVEVQSQMVDISQAYADLPLEAQRECLARFESTVASLERTCADLADALKRKADPHEVQVTGLHMRNDVTGLDFEVSFKNTCDDPSYAKRFRPEPSPYTKAPNGLVLVTETNYELNAKKELSGNVKECFLRFQTGVDAAYALGLKRLPLRILSKTISESFYVTFAKPVRDFTTRETLRAIGTRVDRLKEIERELLSIGAVRQGGSRWVPETRLQDRSFFLRADGMPAWKRIRAAGAPLGDAVHGLLRCVKPVDMSQLMERIGALSNEECDVLIQLREFQLDGWDFEF